MDNPYEYVSGLVTGLAGGTVIGLVIAQRTIVKGIVRSYKAALRRAMRRTVLINTTRINHNLAVTTLTINGVSILKMIVSADTPIELCVTDRHGKEVPNNAQDAPVSSALN